MKLNLFVVITCFCLLYTNSSFANNEDVIASKETDEFVFNHLKTIEFSKRYEQAWVYYKPNNEFIVSNEFKGKIGDGRVEFEIIYINNPVAFVHTHTPSCMRLDGIQFKACRVGNRVHSREDRKVANKLSDEGRGLPSYLVGTDYKLRVLERREGLWYIREVGNLKD